jgi:outer membrane receptor for ferrienterochelin and colicin
MIRPNRLGTWAGVSAIVATLGLLQTVSAVAEEEIEEVVVTGSYLKRNAADSPSPLSVISRADMEDIGAFDMKDITRSLTFASGSLGGSSTPFFAGDSSTGAASLNLRNLGSGATLILINGKRMVNTNYDGIGSAFLDVQSIIPPISIDRIEIVKDGSSALYGSDAVAGVVNFITRKNFEGVEMSFDYAVDDETGEQTDMVISMIMGASSDAGSITVSGSYMDRSELNIGDRYDRYGRSGLSTFGQPGRYVALAAVTPNPDSYFVPGSTNTSYGEGADPDCDMAAADDGPMGVQGNVNGLCIYDFSSFFSLVQPMESYKVHMDAEYALSDDLEFYGSASFSDSYSERNNSLYPDVSFATIAPNHFGNQLDAERRGINPVTLLALQRMMGGTVDSSFEDRPLSTISTYERTLFQVTAGIKLDFDIAGRSWNLDTSISHSENEQKGSNPGDTLTSNTNNAYIGLGGPACNQQDQSAANIGSGNLGTGDCYFYNNFATSVYDPVSGARWDTSDTSPWAADPSLTVQEAARKYQNPNELLQWMQGEIGVQTSRNLTIFDIVIAGDVMDLPAGALGLAIGAQHRKDQTQSNIDTASNNNNFKFIYGAQDWDNKLTTTAFFAEIFIPITDWADLQLAGRFEDFDEIGEDSFDPKATLMLRPTDSLTLRASVGTSFRVGSLLQLGGENTSLLNSTDPISGTGGLAFRPSITSGNATLVPEESTMFNLGFSWVPVDGALEGLSIDFDYYNYDYDNLISKEAHQALIDEDNALRCPNGLNSDPAAGALCGVSDQNGDGVNEFYSVGEGIPLKVIRRTDGGLLRTEAAYFNAPSLETDGFDLNVTYDWDWTNVGSFRASFAGSYTLSYDIVNDRGVKIDGVGSRNNANSIGRPLPEYKINGSLRWSLNRHAVIATVRYVDEFEDDTGQSALRGAYGFFAPTIDSMTTVDLQYNLELPSFSMTQGSNLTLGIKNVANEEPPIENVDGGYDYFTHDPLGRIYYARYSVAF